MHTGTLRCAEVAVAVASGCCIQFGVLLQVNQGKCVCANSIAWDSGVAVGCS